VPSSSTSKGGITPAGLHSTLDYLSPVQYEMLHHNADRQAA
jgi:hypothetical protein